MNELDNLRFGDVVTDLGCLIKEVGASRVWSSLRASFPEQAGELYIAMLQEEKKIPALCKPPNANPANRREGP